MARAERGETLWSRVVVGVRGIAAKGHAIVAAMGLAPQERDPLVPERAGALSPGRYAAAQAVSAGVRHLSQNEAGFSRLDLIRASLNFGGPIGVADIEARAAGVFFVVQLNRRNGDNITAPGRETRIEAGDGVVVVGRSSQAINALFAAPRQTARGGRL